jgi:hypothetical protein
VTAPAAAHGVEATAGGRGMTASTEPEWVFGRAGLAGAAVDGLAAALVGAA